VLLAAGLLVCLPGCASTRGPTPEEFPRIISAVRQRLAIERGTLPDSAPVGITIRNRHAVVTYSAEYEMGQFAFYPMKTELEWQTNSWNVVGHKSNRSWLWHVANHTIGVK
jgi:hypothetical protein